MIKTNEISFLPNKAGCYIFKNEKKEILYVGKAKNLKKRVSSYFQKKDHDKKTALLVENIVYIDFIITKNESEALLLESNLIKLYYPKFNIDLKDSRRYAYLKINVGEIPWVEVARVRQKTGEYYGPFVSGQIRKQVLLVIERNFKVLTRAPSLKLKKLIDKVEYNKRINAVRKLLKGQVDELIKDLEKEMISSSIKTNYEYSIVLRNQINALKTLKEKQVMELSKTIDAQVINYEIINDEVFILVFNIRKGVVEDKQEFVIDYYSDFFEEFLIRFYDAENKVNALRQVILPIEISEVVKKVIMKSLNTKIKFMVPKSGEKKELLDFVKKNISATFFSGNEKVIELQKQLHLRNIPRVIECFDISHLSGKNTVAGMVTFSDGVMDKKNYRLFKIKANANSDDLVSMEEAVRRRYSGSLSKKMNFPDLIVIDGGKTQLSVANNVLKDLNLKIPIISLAKKFEEIYIPSSKTPIVLSKDNKALLLLMALRDEAHRFSNGYRKKLKSNEIWLRK